MDALDIKIENLADHPKWVKVVAKRHYDEWNASGGRVFDSMVYRVKHSLKKNTIPQTLVAIQGKKLVGTVALLLSGLKARPDLSPRLTSLYVLPEYRRRNIGTLLQNRVLKTAKRLGYTYLYLDTKLEGYYERNGWKFMEMVPYSTGEMIRLYKHKL